MRVRFEIAATRHPMRRRFGYAPGRGYSRFVYLSKRLFPVLAAGVLLMIALWPRIEESLDKLPGRSTRLDLSEARELRMTDAHYSGVDRQDRPFTITANVARQSPKQQDLVSLTGPKADLTTRNGSWIELTAATGLYQPQPQLLDLFGSVELYQDRGNEFHSASAHINVANGTAEGKQPVTGQGPFGNVKAQGFIILDRGNTIVFTGHTELELISAQKAAS